MPEKEKNTKKKKKMTKKKKRFIIIAGIAGFLLVFSIAAIEYTSHSGFCAACHYMKPFFQSWETSSHSQFECSACHYPPSGGIRSKLRKKVEGLVMVGRYWTKLYVKAKPWAEIRDENCLMGGCHDKRLLEGQVQFNKVVFDHKIHLEDLKRGKQLQCTSCHSQIVQGEHITVTDSSCFICHFKESEHYPQIDDCSHCHTKETLTNESTSRYNHTLVFDNGFTCDKCHSQTVIGDGNVPRENCYKCHWERARLEQYDDTDLMHSRHIYENKIECNQCHMEIQHKIIKDVEAIADCKSCHTDLHRAQKILYTGEGGKGVSHPMPNIMLVKGLSCKGCHIFHEKPQSVADGGKTYTADANACESCHGKGYARILKQWEASTSKKLHQIQAVYERTLQEIRKTRNPNKENAQALLDEAALNIEIVDQGKSVHNMAFSLELLQTAYNKLSEALDSVQSSYIPEEFVAVTEEIPTQCSSCHTGIEEIDTQIFGLDFPHKKHLIEQKIDCTKCHSNVRTHGEFIASKKSCAVCHHKDPEKDCTSCHQLQQALYQGGIMNGHDVPRDIMAEAEVSCPDCHRYEQDNVIRPGKIKCLDCHEEDYGEMFTEWQENVNQLMLSLANSLKDKKRLKLSQEQTQLINKVEKTLQKIKLDGSKGVHNYMYVEEILTNSIKKIESMQRPQ